MVRCPKCRREVAKPRKKWKYGAFDVQAFSCDNCGTQFREYTKKGKHSFALKVQKGKGFIKA